MKNKAILILTGSIFLSNAMANELTVVSYGGPSKIAQADAYYTPFENATGNRVNATEWNGEMGKIKAMVDTRSVTWDVVQVEAPSLRRGCEEGLFEKLDKNIVERSADFVPGTVSPCGVGILVWAMTMAYNADKVKTAPSSWQDFWDVKKYPGKRGMVKSAEYNLEIALMADGVPTKDVYKVLSTKDGVDRAFKKLDQLKSHIQWWEAGAQPPQYLAAGDVVMSTTWSGRIPAARQEGVNLKNVWTGNIYGIDSWAIPKGSKNKKIAEQFIRFTEQPEQQKIYSSRLFYGPTNIKTNAMLAPKVVAEMSSSPQNLQTALALDAKFWVENGEDLEQRFRAWATK
ncbi:ABC transporter substrate-binding protein [Burkholderia cepacia]|uniref:Polyamine ABC transporter periplasmic polyamine-binding protein n=1 Tax=Burkholderia cepacia GG4 TaxID=1009846 RepID=A0A9W3PBZ5_BURCE|nr:ABC transporter substrate-binding protein [Burkholderia cepacia]AFQ51120.1 polyamine ABC transporter periplasmic polyamine-binding protein [Burkholderia cepacia GG4]